MTQLATVDLSTGELVLAHDAKALTTPEEGAQYVRYFQKAVASCKAIGADRAKTNKYAEQLVRHVRETGRLIEKLHRGKGGRGKTDPSGWASFIKSTGVKPSTAQNWQALTTHITDTAFDERIEALKADDESVIALKEFYALVKAVRRAGVEQRKEIRRAENAELVAATPDALAVGARFATIMIDPPWDWGDEGDVDQLGRARPSYATMSIEQIEALPLADLADEDSHLYLWITNRSLPKGFRLLEAWGFRYVTCITWAKPHFGMGNYFRGQTEHVLFGVKGSQQLKRKDVGTLFTAARGPNGHSSKPPEFYDLIESCSPGPYLEMFARSARAEWKRWGADANAP